MLTPNKEIVRRLYTEAFTHTGDAGVVDEFVAQDFLDHSAAPGLPEGRAGFAAAVALWRSAFPDIELMVDSLVESGDTVAIGWTGTGTHRGELFGIPPTGVHATLRGIAFNRIEDGRVVERRQNSTDLSLMQALGVAPRPGGSLPTTTSNGSRGAIPSVGVRSSIEAVKAFYNAVDNGDEQLAAAVVTDDWLNVDADLPPLAGPDGAAMLVATLSGAFPKFRTEFVELFAEGDVVAAHIRHTATHDGRFLGIPATGRTATVTASGIFRVRDGRLAENHVIFDALGLLTQLGVVPQPAAV